MTDRDIILKLRDLVGRVNASKGEGVQGIVGFSFEHGSHAKLIANVLLKITSNVILRAGGGAGAGGGGLSEGTPQKAPLDKKLWVYYMLDALVKEREDVFAALVQRGALEAFQKDLKEALLKEQLPVARDLVILFLTWEGYFASTEMHAAVDALYAESGFTSQFGVLRQPPQKQTRAAETGGVTRTCSACSTTMTSST